jgi:hypothetical protein
VLYVGLFCTSLDGHVLLKLPKETEVTERHTAKQTCDCLRFCRWVVMGDLSFSSDLVSRDFHLFVSFRKHLVGDLQQTLT